MEKKKNKKELELESFDIVTCKDKELQSFLNVFHFKEENLDKSQMGEVFGAIQVFDHSEQSAYLPNLIAQVIRKEFFQNTKLTSEESFEKALKKANIALSDLTRHEVVGWMGKLHAVMGVIQGDNFFFTQSGGGKILLSREGKINDISRDLDDNNNTHPVKTFSNISSGKLLVNDKLIFATDSLFESLSWEDLKRHTRTFNSSEFDNLVKSTLESEGENVALLTVNIKERNISPIASLPRTKKSKSQNFFGKDDEKNRKKDKATKKEEALEEETPEKVASPADLKQEKAAKEKEKIDEMKGLSPFEMQPELFIKEGDATDEDTEKQHEKNVIGRIKSAVKKTKGDGASFVDKIKTKTPKKEEEKKEINNKKLIKSESIVIESKTAAPQNEDQKDKAVPVIESKKEKIKKAPPVIIKKGGNDVLEKRKEEIHKELTAFYEQPKQEKKPITIEDSSVKKDAEERLSLPPVKDSRPNKKSKSQKIKKIIIKKVHPKKIKENLNYHKEEYLREIETLKNRLKTSRLTMTDILKSRYLFSTIIIFFIIILILVLSFNREPSKYSTINDTANQETPPPEDEINYIEEKEVSVREIGRADSNVIDITGYKNDVYVIAENHALYKYDSNINKFGGVPMTDGIDDTISIVSVPVLNLVFFTSNDSVYSYSPVLDKFAKHNIKMPIDAKILGTGVHFSLSYLYVFDKTSGQIYRYPRVEGGFGSPDKWFEKTVSTEGVVDFAIDDGIRIAYDDGTIEHYYERKLKSSFLIDTEPRVIPRKIYTDTDTNYYYILDQENPRVLKINKEDNSVKDQYWNKELENAKNLSVHENKEAYIITEDNKLLKFELKL